jgi:rhamnose utilization protein RhaD (predicted bifunctional aldolase and dehydrogenase)/NAD(P)-dependent dehydrogenase (short-subunit alcohol dehydrogenase family)
MENLWTDEQADATAAGYASDGVDRERALRVHSARLLGGDGRLVLHGGGNASLKALTRDRLGDETEVLYIKGSGRDMAAVEPADLPAVRLVPLRRLLALETLADIDLVDILRGNLLESRAPDPSVEVLVHAFLPHRVIDHTHANAVLSLTNQADGAEICAEVFGGRAAVVPYAMSGLTLAKRVHAVFEANPEVEGLILMRHGIVTFGDTAAESYGRMIDLVSLAEARLAQAGPKAFVVAALPGAIAPAAEVAPILRGLAAVPDDPDERTFQRFVLDFRAAPDVLDYVNGAEIARYSQQGPATPDHVIRTKQKPMIVPVPEAGALDAFSEAAATATEAYRAEYHDYFARHAQRQGTTPTQLDGSPRVILVPGLGLFGLGRTARDAAIAADLAEATAAIVRDAEALGRFQSIPEADAFDIEYWSLEQAKLGRRDALPLGGHVAVVTGGASGIGAATARAFAAAGAEVAVLDLVADAAVAVAKEFGGLGLACDVTDTAAVQNAFDRVCEAFGGVDIVVSNAGNAWQGEIGTVDDEILRQSFELNFWSHQTVAQNAVRVMRAQGTGGCLLFNASKQAVNPGPKFGPYGLPKAALMFLMRQYAVDHGTDGIRSNAVNADRIRSGLLSDEMVASRSTARGLSEKDYMSGNLLGLEVTGADVAQAFVDLALAAKTTGSVVTVDGGNIAAALR